MEKIFAVAGVVVLSFLGIFSSSHKPAASLSTVNHTVTANGPQVNASGEITLYGQTVGVHLSFPKKGGAVAGSVSGVCSGPITGTYSGGNDGDLSASTKATCTAFFRTIMGTADFDGKAKLSENLIMGSYTVKAGTVAKSGSLTLFITQ